MKYFLKHTAMAMALPIVLTAAGCASSLNGYKGAADQPKCSPDTNGIPCTPLSRVYQASMAGVLPGQVNPSESSTGAVAYRPAEGQANPNNVGALPTQPDMVGLRMGLDSGTPVRTAPRVLRVWIAPWEDAAGVLNDQKLVYLTVDGGRWLLEHNQRKIMDQYAPTQLRQGGPAANEPAMNSPGASGMSGMGGIGGNAVNRGNVSPSAATGNQNGLPIRSMNNSLEQLGIGGQPSPTRPGTAGAP